MRRKISILPNLLISQISAGEVIDRPASIVKELMENSIDAEASLIEVHLNEGGINCIEVLDNGIGIPKDELNLSLKRHTTSKICSFNELCSVNFLGFRGEAIASIASISQLNLTSRTKEQAYAWTINSSDFTITPFSGDIGTTVKVFDIFNCVPVRKKSLKTSRIEFGFCVELFESIALAYPQIHFKLFHNNKISKNFQPISYLGRIKQIFGEKITKKSIEINANLENFGKITGVLLEPNVMQIQSKIKHFYVNNRRVHDRLIDRIIHQNTTHTMRRLYQYGYVLSIEVNPNLVDVNIHPKKSSIQFRNEEIYNSIASVINNTINESTVTSKEYKFHGSFENKQLELDYLHTSRSRKNIDLGQAIGQLHNTYIIAQNNHGLILIDMHAAHERIMYEKLKKEFSSGFVATQMLLPPIIFNTKEKFIGFLEIWSVYIKKFGFDIGVYGPETIILRSAPAILKINDFPKYMCALFNDLEKFGKNLFSSETKKNELLYSIACHSALHSNEELTNQEMNNLLREMEVTDNIHLCNHGRPTWMFWNKQDLDKLFLRGQ